MQGKPGPPRIPRPTLIENTWEIDKSTITPGEPLTVTLTQAVRIREPKPPVTATSRSA